MGRLKTQLKLAEAKSSGEAYELDVDKLIQTRASGGEPETEGQTKRPSKCSPAEQQAARDRAKTEKQSSSSRNLSYGSSSSEDSD